MAVAEKEITDILSCQPLSSVDEELHGNPLNLDTADFDCEIYLSQLIKKKSLQELLQIEDSMVHEVRQLDSEMQQLVYENYNKFITATGTVRKMRSDLASMEQQMDSLADSMHRITIVSDRVSNALSGQKDNVRKLARANRTMKSLEFLFDLPARLQSQVDRKEYSTAVKAFNAAKSVFERYQHVPSLAGIYAECMTSIDEVRDQLRQRLRSKIVATDQVADTVSLLGLLDEPHDRLADELLVHSEQHLTVELDDLDDQVRLKSGDMTVPDQKVHRPSDSVPNLPMDVLEFVDFGCSSFFGNLSIVMVVYLQLFADVPDADGSNRHVHLDELVQRLLDRCLDIAGRRFLLEDDIVDSGLLVRALDRFYRRLTAVCSIFPQVDCSSTVIDLVLKIAHQLVVNGTERTVSTLQIRIKDARTQLVAGQRTILPTSDNYQLLCELLARLEQSLLHDLKTVLANLLQFTATDVTFTNVDEFLFIRPLGRLVREDLIISFFDRVVILGDEFCLGHDDKAYVNATLILVLSRFCKNLESSTVGYLLDLCEQQFRILVDRRMIPSTTISKKLGAVAQRLLDRYVEMEGFGLSQLLVKSVETRDWMSCAEPRSVRTVMKRVVEDLTAIDGRVGQLLVEGGRKDRSSDSSRRTAGFYNMTSPRTARSSQPLSGDSALTNTLGKLWTERIDYFTTVQFDKVSVMTGIVKICLKTLLESVRLRTFSTYGLQQVQVDCHYLLTYLWKFVFDEHLVHCLLDEVVSSTVQRCTDPRIMEPSVVELICEQG